VGCGSSPCERGAKRARNEGRRPCLNRFLIRQVRQAIEKRRRTKSIRDRQSEAQTSKVHEEPIKSIILVSHKTSSTSDEKQRRTKSIRDRQSEAQTSEVHEEPIKSII